MIELEVPLDRDFNVKRRVSLHGRWLRRHLPICKHMHTLLEKEGWEVVHQGGHGARDVPVDASVSNKFDQRVLAETDVLVVVVHGLPRCVCKEKAPNERPVTRWSPVAPVIGGW